MTITSIAKGNIKHNHEMYLTTPILQHNSTCGRSKGGEEGEAWQKGSKTCTPPLSSL